MLAVRHPLISFQRPDFETNAELLVCEIRLVNKQKFSCAFFYRSPSTGVEYMKAFQHFLSKVAKLLFLGIFISLTLTG